MSDRSASTGISETRKKDKVGSLDSLAQSVQDGKSWNQNRAYFLRTGDYSNNAIFKILFSLTLLWDFSGLKLNRKLCNVIYDS